MKRTVEQERGYNKLLQSATIYKSQVRAFEFMSGMSKDLDYAVASLDSYVKDSLMCAYTQLDLLRLQNYYYTIANQVGEAWREVC